jgi:hypothetical protein
MRLLITALTRRVGCRTAAVEAVFAYRTLHDPALSRLLRSRNRSPLTCPSNFASLVFKGPFFDIGLTLAVGLAALSIARHSL